MCISLYYLQNYAEYGNFLLRIIGDFFEHRQMTAIHKNDCIQYADSGKPFLLRSSGEVFLSFSLSYSANTAVIALCRHGNIGVDIEYVSTQRTFTRMQATMEFFFNSGEKTYVQECMQEQQEGDTLQSLPAQPLKAYRRFYEVWTRKEAAVKALGYSVGSHGSLVDSRADVWLHTQRGAQSSQARQDAVLCEIRGTSFALAFPQEVENEYMVSIARESKHAIQLGDIQSINACSLFSPR